MVNSFNVDAYKEMHQILDVFASSKAVDAIGENGVGVKQASASLSNFNVVLTRKGGRFQVGILCGSMMKQEGVVIPSYTFDEGSNWVEEIQNLAETDELFKEAMIYLGGKRALFMEPDDQYYDEDQLINFNCEGQERLYYYMVELSRRDGEWGSFECVFALLLDQIRGTEDPASDLMVELRTKLPKLYVHLTAQTCDILIGNQPLIFQYWERRLVELTCFTVKISRTVSYMYGDLDEPQNDANYMRVYLGFDTMRCSDRAEQAAASLFIYSRECGRLVKEMKDARTELALTAGGTSFCQGLTIILDDFESSLPLTPTKQDIAYSDGPNGEVHKANVTNWLRALVTTYYQHYMTVFSNQKGIITKEVKNHYPNSQTLKKSEDYVIPLAHSAYFNSFRGHSWARRQGRISVARKGDIEVVSGDGTLMQFTSCMPSEAPIVEKKTKSRPAAKRASAISMQQDSLITDGARESRATRHARTSSYADESEPEDESQKVPYTPSPSSRKRRKTSVLEVEDERYSESAEVRKQKETNSKLAKKNEELLDTLSELRNQKLRAETDLEQLKISYKSEVDSYKKEIESYKTEIEELKSDQPNGASSKEVGELKRQLALQKAEADGLRQELDAKNKQLLAYDENSDSD